jgi:raffinose/stachyose/melibiose transport system permease protein
MKIKRMEGFIAFLFALPTLAVFTLFVTYSLIQIFYKSLFEWDGVTKGTFIFLENFSELFIDSKFYTSITNGLISAVLLTVIQLVIATVLALVLLDKNIFGKRLLSKAYFIPVVISVSVICQLWTTMYNPSYGLFNKIFEVLGIPYQQEWLSSRNKSSMIALVMTITWQYVGYQFLLIYAGAKTIPEHFFEAAKIDGASKLQTHVRITVPLLAETYKICLIFTITGGLNAFAHIQIMTNGGPGTATFTLPFLMYTSAFTVGEFGYGCAVAVIIVLQSFACTLLINRYIARERITF